jgi:hypothetical protein
VEERRIPGQVVHEHALHGGRARAGRHQAVPREDPPRPGAHDEDRPAGGEEENPVRGVAADARDGRELRPERGEGLAQEAPQAAAVATRDVAEEGPRRSRRPPGAPGAVEGDQPSG